MRLGLTLLAVCGCATGLKYSVDENAVANVGPSERKDVLAAQTELQAAYGERQKAEADLNQTQTLLHAAEQDEKQAALEADRALDAQKQAEQSHDINHMNTANRNKEVAAAGQRAADAKVAWLDKKARAARAALVAAERRVAAAQAHYELEKARICQAKGIKPTNDFQLAHFESQYEQASVEYQAAKNDADAEATDAGGNERTWKDVAKRYQEMKGGQ